MMSLTVAAPSSTVVEVHQQRAHRRRVRGERTQTLVAMPNMPSLPTNAPRRS
jgi:hypothetical protein